MDASQLVLAPDLEPQTVHALLTQFGFSDSKSADERIQRLAEIGGDRERLAKLLPDLLRHLSVSADPDVALLRLESFFEAVSSPGSLLAYLLESGAAREAAAQLFGASAYLTQILLRNPEYLSWLEEAGRLRRVPSKEDLLRECAACLRFSDPGKALDSLRRFRRRQSLRIAAQDLLRLEKFGSIVAQLSRLAEVVLETVLQLLLRETGSAAAPFSVLALGKLGGGELNFSSDIDLIYLYGDGGEENRTLRFARQYTSWLSEYSGEGRLYRVDLRLRPMGRRGAIAYPLSAYRHYYETAADTLDRLALIKCRRVAGDPELAQRYLETTSDFVYRKYLDMAAVEEIRWLKARTESEMSSRESARNVKLGQGGIREIEFFAQSLQLLYGGGHPELRTPTTLTALDRLVDSGFVSSGDHRTLREAYILLREIEHRLQLVEDRQTQIIPDDPREKARLLRRLRGPEAGPPRTDSEALELDELRSRAQRSVRRLYASLLQQSEVCGVSELVLDPRLDQTRADAILKGQGIEQPAEFFQAIQDLSRAQAFPHGPGRLRNLLANLLPLFLETCRDLPEPQRLLIRFDQFCGALGARGQLYQSLNEDDALARRLLKVLAGSDFLTQTLIRFPELLDAVARPEEASSAAGAFQQPLPVTAKTPAIAPNLAALKKREEFKIALGDLDGVVLSESRARLSRLAELCLCEAARLATERFPALKNESLNLFGLGKLGGRELTYHSDLDLVVVYNDETAASSGEEFNAWVEELRSAMEGRGPGDRSYRLDFRLRPEGRRSAPATPLSALRRYFEKRAEPWERLAYVKLRPLFSLGKELEVDSLLPEQPLQPEEIKQLRGVRQRLETEIAREETSDGYDFKAGPGGLMDIQFVVQFLQIQHGLSECNTEKALARLIRTGAIQAADGETLLSGLRFLQRLETIARLLAERSTNRIWAGHPKIRLISRFLGFDSPDSLIELYLKVRRNNRRVYDHVFTP